MKTNLYSLLNDIELDRVKNDTDIRNCKLLDLTLSELNELGTLLIDRHRPIYNSIYPSIRALKVLLNRVSL